MAHVCQFCLCTLQVGVCGDPAVPRVVAVVISIGIDLSRSRKQMEGLPVHPLRTSVPALARAVLCLALCQAGLAIVHVQPIVAEEHR